MSTTKDKADLLDNAEDIALDDVAPNSDDVEPPAPPVKDNPRTERVDTIHVDTPVYYSTNGSANDVHQPTVFNQTDDHRVIITPGPGDAPPSERRLREADLNFLRVFSFISIFVFPPTGIAAYIYARDTERKFHEGVQRGDTSRAQKSSDMCEKLIIASLVVGLLSYMFLFSLTEKFIFAMDETPMRFPSDDYSRLD